MEGSMMYTVEFERAWSCAFRSSYVLVPFIWIYIGYVKFLVRLNLNAAIFYTEDKLFSIYLQAFFELKS
jgi:hypothetical protein